MIIIFVGLTLLLTTTIPIGGEIARYIMGSEYASAFQSFSPIMMGLLSIVITYLPAAVVVGIFLQKTRLATRLPVRVPGKGLLTTAIVITFAFVAARLFASTIEGGGASFTVSHFSIYPLLLARVLLVVGSVKVLLSAKPIDS